MKILNLKLDNFQGLRDESYDFKGQSASIYGDNATGKTTVFNAITWLLFDKASTGAKNFTPKTKDADGDMHYLDHAVEAQFAMDDGRIVTLRKVFHEVYKKKRGSATEEFDGHTIDFFIDGVPTKEKEYNATLLRFCGDAEKMKMLTMPTYFAEEMPWDARRKLLLEICGDVSDEDVISSSPELRELPEYLRMPGAANQRYTVDEYKKIAAAKKTDINKQLAAIPGRIDEAQRAIPETPIDPEAIQNQLTRLTVDLNTLITKKTDALTGNTAAAEARKATVETVTAIAEAKAAHRTLEVEANAQAYEAIDKVKGKLSDVRTAVKDTEAEIQRHESNISRMEERRNELLKEYETVFSESWDEAQAVCPTCHRELPETDITRMREEFNTCKSNRLQKINERGIKEADKTKIKEEWEQIEKLSASIESSKAEIETLEGKLAELTAKVKTPALFETTPEYDALATKLAACRAHEEDVSKYATEIVDELSGEISTLQSEIQELQQRKGQAAQVEIQQARIGELKAQEKTLSAEYEELEAGIYLCDLFTKAKVNALTDRINGKFKSVRFRLFVEQINGGLKEDCEVMIPTDTGRMVPYTFANNAARINAGLEIIDVLSKHWDIAMPVVIDNAESVTRLLPVDTQVIRLVVSEADKVLRLKLDKNRNQSVA